MVVVGCKASALPGLYRVEGMSHICSYKLKSRLIYGYIHALGVGKGKKTQMRPSANRVSPGRSGFAELAALQPNNSCSAIA